MEQVFQTVQTVWTNANTAIDAAMSLIRNSVTAGWNAVASATQTGLDGIKNVIVTIWKAIASVIESALNGIKKIVLSVWNAMHQLIKTGQLDIKSVVTTTWNAVKDVVSTVLNGIKSVVTSIWNAMPDIVRKPMDKVKDAVLSIWDSIKKGINDRLSAVRDAVSSAMNAVYSAIREKVDSSWTWGRDLMQNLINGISYMIGNLINTVADVARAISEYLHFSVPDKGPLSKFEAWMPDFMKGLADGINKSKKYVEKAVSSVADAMQNTLESGLTVDMDGVSGAMVRGRSESVINNYTNYNTQNFNQTNNSPKAINRYESYRQMKNLIHTVKMQGG